MGNDNDDSNDNYDNDPNDDNDDNDDSDDSDDTVTPTYTVVWPPAPAEVGLVQSSNVGREPLMIL